jgi:hypothetical protein
VGKDLSSSLRAGKGLVLEVVVHSGMAYWIVCAALADTISLLDKRSRSRIEEVRLIKPENR